jgi:beta-lactam-binding protein with PASTA domain
MNLKDTFYSILAEVGYFFRSKLVLKNLAKMLLIFGAILFLIFVLILPFYTRHNEEVKVIDITNLDIDQAKELLNNLGLKMQVTDTTYNPGKKPGVVIEQTPKKDARVKPNRTIYVTVNSDEAPMVALRYEQVITLSLEQVERRFKSLDLKVGRKKYVPGRPENTISAVYLDGKLLFKEVNQSKGERKPTESQSIPKGAVLDLDLYKGQDAELMEVPNLLCKTYEEASIIIQSNEFYVGNLKLSASVKKDTANAYVVRQSPRSSENANMGTAIDLWLDKYPPDNCDEEEE